MVRLVLVMAGTALETLCIARRLTTSVEVWSARYRLHSGSHVIVLHVMCLWRFCVKFVSGVNKWDCCTLQCFARHVKGMHKRGV